MMNAGSRRFDCGLRLKVCTQGGKFRDGHILLLGSYLLLFEIGYWAVTLGLAHFWANYDEFNSLYWPIEARPRFVNHLIPYDGAFYVNLAESGYHSGMQACAFYPLWPMMMRYTAQLVNGNLAITGLILANIFSLIGFVLFYAIVSVRWGADVAKWSLVTLIMFPGSLFYHFVYSESLFLLLLMVLWWGLERRKYGLCFIAALLLPLTRAIGVFCFFPIAWHVLATSCPDNFVKRWPTACRLIGAEGVSAVGDKAWKGWWLIFVPFCGWLIYLFLMFIWTGNIFEGFSAQEYWGVHAVSHLWNFPKFIVAWLSPQTWHAYTGSLLDRAVFTIFIFSIPLMWRTDKKLIPWAYVLGILPAMSGTFTSYTRFACLAFPFFVALGALLSKHNSPWHRFIVLNAFGLLQAVLVWRYLNFQWAS